ncbi:MAG: sodium:solute symporter family protein [Patescibacteria group bacterium]|nr:sodium:solute symporter family protein [Patescibacteria group bacterium]
MADPTAVLQQTNFTAIDWVIVILYPLISVGIGLYVRKLVVNMSDFVVAGRGLGVCLGIATMTGTELGLITVMYSSQKGFTGGFAAFHIALAAGIVTFLVGATGLFVYRLREMGVMTIPEFYERRFDRKTRILGGIMMATGGILNMGLFLKVSSMFLVGITGLSAASVTGEASVDWVLTSVMIALTALVLVYTCLGGMVSVVIADYVQFVVLSFGLLAASALAMYHLGWDNIFSTVQQDMGKAGFDPTVAESGFGWEYIIWMGFTGLVSCAIWPTAVARALAMDSPRAVKRQYMFTSVSFMIRFLIPYFWGICAFVFVMQHTELKQLFFPAGYPIPKSMPEGVSSLDNLLAMPLMLGRVLPMGLIGLITAGMLAAFMSTHDSYLLCWSSVLTQDVIAPLREARGRPISAKARVALTRVLIVVIGVAVLIWGIVYVGEDDIWDYMAVTGAIYSTGAFALLLGGLYWRRASSTGAFLGLLTGCSAVLGLSPVQKGLGFALTWLLKATSPIWGGIPEETSVTIEISGARVGLITVGVTVFVMVVGSLLFPDRKGPDRKGPDPKGNEQPQSASKSGGV